MLPATTSTSFVSTTTRSWSANLDDAHLARQTEELRNKHRDSVREDKLRLEDARAESHQDSFLSGAPHKRPHSAPRAFPAVSKGTTANQPERPSFSSAMSLTQSSQAEPQFFRRPKKNSTPKPQSSLLASPTRSGEDKKVHSDMGEMGYLHFRVHALVNLDERNGRHSWCPLSNKALFSAELVTADYSRKKTIFTNGDITKPSAWGDGLYFRIFQADKEAQFELKASLVESSVNKGGAGEGNSDFGLCRLVIVPALDLCTKPLWQSMRERMGNVNHYRLLVSWRYSSKLNNIRPSALGLKPEIDFGRRPSQRKHRLSSTAPPMNDKLPNGRRQPIFGVPNARRPLGTKMVFDGYIRANEKEFECIDDEELFCHLCSNDLDLKDSKMVDEILFLSRNFHFWRKSAHTQVWERLKEAHPVKQWWEEPDKTKTVFFEVLETHKNQFAASCSPMKMREISKSPVSGKHSSSLSLCGRGGGVTLWKGKGASSEFGPVDSSLAALSIQRVFRGHLGRIGFFFTALHKHALSEVAAEREKWMTENANLEKDVVDMERALKETQDEYKMKLGAVEAEEERIQQLQQKVQAHFAKAQLPRVMALEELQRARDYETNMAALAHTTRRNLKRLGRVAEILNHTSKFNHLEKALLNNYQASRELQEQNLGLDKYFSNEEYTECGDDEEQWVAEQLTVLADKYNLSSEDLLARYKNKQAMQGEHEANDTAFARGRRQHQPGRKMKLLRSSTLSASPNLSYSRGASVTQDVQPLMAQGQWQLLLAPADVSESPVDVLSEEPEPSLEKKEGQRQVLLAPSNVSESDLDVLSQEPPPKPAAPATPAGRRRLLLAPPPNVSESAVDVLSRESETSFEKDIERSPSIEPPGRKITEDRRMTPSVIQTTDKAQMRRHSEQMDASFFRSKRQPFSYSERRLPVDDDAVAKELTLRMKEIKACFAKEMEALVQLAAAVKARQICEQRLESIVVVQGDAGKEDLIAEAINKLQPQRHDLEQLQTCIDELEIKRSNLFRKGRVLDKMFADIERRESEIVQAARRGQLLYDNLSCQGLPLNGDEGYASEETTESDRIEMRERNGELLLQDLAEAYNNTEPSAEMQAILQDFQPQFQNCHMGIRAPKSIAAAGLDSQVLYDAKVATFRFLYDQIQHGSGIMRTLDSTTLQPMDIIKLMDISTLLGSDAGESIFEQNSEGDEFGTIMTGHVKVLYNRRDVSNLIKGQAFCDLGLMTPGMNQIRGASFRAEVRTYVILIPYQKFADHVKILGSKFENAVRDYIRQSFSIGRENWSQYGNAAKSIEIYFLEFMSRQSGLLGLFNMVEIRNLANVSTYRKLKQNEVLCKQGDLADSMYIVLSGLACVIINGKNVAYITRGQELGELGLIANFSNTRTATIHAHFDFEVAEIKYEDFFYFFDMLHSKRAQKVADFIASCALSKYFSLSEWKKEAIGRGEPHNVDPSKETRRKSGAIGSIGDFFRGGSFRGKQSSHKKDEDANLATLTENNHARNETPGGVGDTQHSQGANSHEPENGGNSSTTKLLLSRHELLASARNAKPRNVCTVPDKNPRSKDPVGDECSSERGNQRHTPSVTLTPRFAQLLEQFRRQARNRNYIGAPSKRVCPSPFADALALRFSPLVEPVGKSGWSSRLSSAANAATASRPSSTGAFSVHGIASTTSALPDVSGMKGKIAVRQVLSASFRNVAEAFVAFDRLSIDSIDYEDLYSSLMELGLSSNVIEDALRDTMRGNVRLSAYDFFKQFAWHPIEDQYNQDEMLAEAQQRRVLITTSFARAGAARRGTSKGHPMSPNSLEKNVLTAISKNLGPIRAFFASIEGEKAGYKTDFDYARELSKQELEMNLRQIPDLGLAETEIVEAFNILDISKAGSITFAEIEALVKAFIKDDFLSATLLPRPFPGTAFPCPPNPLLTPRDLKYRPHSAKIHRPSATIETASIQNGTRPATAKPRMYTQARRPLSARQLPLSARGADKQLHQSPLSSRGTRQTKMTSPPEQSQNTSSTALCSDGEKLLLQARYEDGATCFSKALALDPSNTAAMVGYAKALIDGYSDFDRAEDLYQRALVVDPTDVLTMRLLANLKRYARKDYENAEEYFRNALVIDPCCPDTLRDYADFKAWRGDEKGALTLCRRILQEDPDNALAQSEVQRLRNIITGKEQQDVNDKGKQKDRMGAKSAINENSSSDVPTTAGADLEKNDLNGIDANTCTPEQCSKEVCEVQCTDAEAFALLAAAAPKVGLESLVRDWGDIKTQTIKLTAISVSHWMDKCLVKLEETVTLAEGFHVVGDNASEALFRQVFAHLLKLYLATEKRMKQGELEQKEVVRLRPRPPPFHDSSLYERQKQDVSQSAIHQDQQQQQMKRGKESEMLRRCLASRAATAESQMRMDLANGRSIDDSVKLNFPSRAINAKNKVPLRLHEIDLPDSVRDAIRKQKYHRGDMTWRAGYATAR